MPAFDERKHGAHVEADSLLELHNAADTLRLLEGWLPVLPVNRLAEIVGMSTRQLQRHHQESGASPQRLQLVARLVAILRHGWTDHGVYAWFHRERLELGGRAPIELLDNAGRERDLLLIARAGRIQGGS